MLLRRAPLARVARELRAASTAAADARGPLAVLRDRVRDGQLREDEHQLAAVCLLERLHGEMVTYDPPPLPPPPKPSGDKEWRGPKFDAYGQPIAGGAMYTGVGSGGDSGGLWSAVTSYFGGAKPKGDGEPTLSGVVAPRGVYMYGGVGCGKSMLMDLFYDHCPVPAAARRRLHFHEFMLEVPRYLPRCSPGKDSGANCAACA